MAELLDLDKTVAPPSPVESTRRVTTTLSTDTRRVAPPRPVLSRKSVGDALAHVLDDSFPGAWPTQAQTTALSVRLAEGLVKEVAKRETFVFGSPKSGETRELLKRWQVRFEVGEFQGDFSVVSADGARICTELVCESEAYPQHGTEYCPGIDALRRRRDHGYQWDFLKLLHTRAPILLYVARLPGKRVGKLTEALTRCARTYSSLWGEATLIVLALPTAKRDRLSTQIGYGLLGSGLRFRSLSDSVSGWPTGSELDKQAKCLWGEGRRTGSAEWEELRAVLTERNEYLWASYGRSLKERHLGRWAAISESGDYVLADSRAEAALAGEQRFAANRPLIVRLDETRGAERLGPRSAHV
jgi:hypothetical protein